MFRFLFHTIRFVILNYVFIKFENKFCYLPEIKYLREANDFFISCLELTNCGVNHERKFFAFRK